MVKSSEDIPKGMHSYVLCHLSNGEKALAEMASALATTSLASTSVYFTSITTCEVETF
jgi:hypothetical protein